MEQRSLLRYVFYLKYKVEEFNNFNYNWFSRGEKMKNYLWLRIYRYQVNKDYDYGFILSFGNNFVLLNQFLYGGIYFKEVLRLIVIIGNYDFLWKQGKKKGKIYRNVL